MWAKVLKGLWWILKNGPAIKEVIDQARNRHPEAHNEEIR